MLRPLNTAVRPLFSILYTSKTSVLRTQGLFRQFLTLTPPRSTRLPRALSPLSHSLSELPLSFFPTLTISGVYNITFPFQFLQLTSCSRQPVWPFSSKSRRFYPQNCWSLDVVNQLKTQKGTGEPKPCQQNAPISIAEPPGSPLMSFLINLFIRYTCHIQYDLYSTVIATHPLYVHSQFLKSSSVTVCSLSAPPRSLGHNWPFEWCIILSRAVTWYM